MNLPKIIPPKTRVKLRDDVSTAPVHRDQAGRTFRVGYYSREDGLDCVWLVNEKGEYEQTVDREYLLKHFEIIRLGVESDPYGAGRPKLRPLAQAKGPRSAARFSARKAG